MEAMLNRAIGERLVIQWKDVNGVVNRVFVEVNELYRDEAQLVVTTPSRVRVFKEEQSNAYYERIRESENERDQGFFDEWEDEAAR